MFALEVEFLTGRYVATAFDDRSRGEWPPHPARLYAALVDAWTTGGDMDPDEAAALEWLATLAPPEIHASPASFRDTPTVFVPVNDAAVLRQQAGLYADLAAAAAALADAHDARDLSEAARGRAVAKAERQVAKTHTRAQALGQAGGDKGHPTVLPDLRVRQPRTFPSATPERPGIVFSWPLAQPNAAHRAALGALARRVVRLGHSSSFVVCTVGSPPPGTAEWTPDPAGTETLRVPAADQLALLVEAHAHHQGVEPRVLPFRVAAYRAGPAATPRVVPTSTLAGEWLVFEQVDGPRLATHQTLRVATALRGALMSAADQPPTPALSGHRADGRPVSGAHAAFLALPFVASRYADGHLLGTAVLLPQTLEAEARDDVLRAVGRLERTAGPDDAEGAIRLTLGRAGVIRLRRVRGIASQRALQPQTWSRPSVRWATVTPIALDRNPGNLHSRVSEVAQTAATRAEATIAAACERIGLPRPVQVTVSMAPLLRATLPATQFPPFPAAKAKTRRVLVHAELRFDQPVSGPIVLGAGRFRGLGLLRPLHQENLP